MTDFTPSDKAREALKAYQNKEIDQAYIMEMNLTHEEKIWAAQEESNLDTDLDSDELDWQGTLRTWGTPELDQSISPIECHQYIILAGVKGKGKTTVAFHIAEANAEIGNAVLFYSIEMSCDGIIRRNARDAAGITQSQWRDKSTITPLQKAAYRRRKTELQPSPKKPLVLIGAGEWETRKIENIMEDVLTYKKKDLVIIDNMDLIESPRNNMENNAKHEYISRYLLTWTSKHNIPVILLHHMNKGGEGLDGIRGSGKITDDADLAVLIERPTLGEGSPPAARFQTNFRCVKDREFGKEESRAIFFNKGRFVDNFEGITSGFSN